MNSLLNLLLLVLAVQGFNGFEWLDEINCKNGGTPNGTVCNCLEYFTGGDCSEIKCLNHGYKSVSNPDRCVCPVGYYGLYCESYQQAPAPTDLFLVKSPDLIIFLNTRVDTAFNSFKIYKDAVLSDPAISRGLKGMYSKYYLYEFDNENSTRTKSYSFDTREKFITEFNKSDLVLRYNEDKCTPEPLFTKILPWIKENQFSQQTINIFTQLPSTNEDLENLENLAVAFNLQFNIYFQYSDIICYPEVKYDTLFGFELLAQRTGGFYWPFYQWDDSSKMVTDLVRSTFNLQLLGYQAYTNCPTTLSTTFNHALGPVDIYALVKSESKNVTIKSSTTFPISKTVAATGTTVIAQFPPITNDTVSVTGANGSCSIEILGIKRDPLETEYLGIKAYVSFTDSIDADSSYFAMKSGVMQYIRIHLENIMNPSFALTPLSVHLSSDCQSNIPTASFSKSKSSTFDYISYTSLNCLAQYNSCQATKHWLTITFNVSQVQNTFTVLRHVPVKCLSSDDNEIPTTEAPPTTQPATTAAPVTTAAEGDTTTAAEQQTTTTIAPTTEAPTTEAPTTEAPTTTAESTTTEAATTTAAAATEAGSTIPPTSFSCPKVTDNLPAMVVGYSVQYDSDTITAFLKSPLILNSSIADPNYGHYVIFTTDDDDSNYDSNHSPADTFTDFIALVTRLSAAYNPGNPNKPTNVISILRKMFDDPKIKDRSAVLILVGSTEPDGVDNDKIEIMQLAASKQIRVNFYIDRTLYQTTADPERFKFYEQVAAVSDGHFIIADVNKPDSPYDGYLVPQKIFATLYFESFPHKLAMSKIVSVTDTPDNLGTLDLTGQTGNRDFYMTASYSPYTNDVNGVFLLVSFTNKNGGQNLGPIPLTCGYGNIGCGAMLSIPAGAAYDVTVLKNIDNDGSTLTYRLWEHWQEKEEYKLKTEYMNFRKQYQEALTGPIYDVGAVPKVTLSQLLVDKIDKLEVEFLDCNGQRVLTFDHYDFATLISNDSTCETAFMVNPFICNFAQTCSLQRDILPGFYTTKYKIRTTDNTVLEYSTNFWCRENTQPLSDQCPYNPSVISTTDAPASTAEPSSASSTVSPIEADCQCLNLTAPHLRGPVCTVSDCSKNGYLQYDSVENDFFCQCKDGYNGTYCEIGICSNTASRTAKDVAYRTFTIAIVHSNRDEFNNIVTELKNADFTTLGKIWQFNLFTVCNGNTKTRYFGTSIDDFNNVLTGLKNNFDSDLLNYCGSSQNIDFTSIVKYGLNSFGKEVRGLFWIATHNSDIIEVTSMIDFYYAVQGYKQELFLTSVFGVDGTQLSNFNATLEAVRVTGGERIDFESYDGSNYAKYIQAIVASETSLNYYELVTKSFSNIEVQIEKNAYVTISNYNLTGGVSVSPDCVAQSTDPAKATVYKCSTPGKITLAANIQNGSALITVRVINGYTPAWIIINETNQDNLEAMPVLNSYPSIAFDFADASINPHDTTPDSFARQAERENCAFKYTSTFQLPVTSIGYDNFEITIDDKYKKIIPYVITDTLESRCKNGNGTAADAKCSCPDHWSGADCSRPICEYGSLNTMQNACYCDLTHSGQTCSTPQQLY